MKRRNIFYRMPTTIGTQICRYHQTHHDYNCPFEIRMPKHRAMVFACVDYTVTPINHSKILTQHFHRLHSSQLVQVPPYDSIYPKYYRTMYPSVYCTTMRLVWNAFFDAQPMKLPPSIGPVSKMVLSVWWMILPIEKNWMTNTSHAHYSRWNWLNISLNFVMFFFSLTFSTPFGGGGGAIVRITVFGWTCIRIDPMGWQLRWEWNEKRTKNEQ